MCLEGAGWHNAFANSWKGACFICIAGSLLYGNNRLNSVALEGYCMRGNLASIVFTWNFSLSTYSKISSVTSSIARISLYTLRSPKPLIKVSGRKIHPTYWILKLTIGTATVAKMTLRLLKALLKVWTLIWSMKNGELFLAGFKAFPPLNSR